MSVSVRLHLVYYFEYECLFNMRKINNCERNPKTATSWTEESGGGVQKSWLSERVTESMPGQKYHHLFADWSGQNVHCHYGIETFCQNIGAVSIRCRRKPSANSIYRMISNLEKIAHSSTAIACILLRSIQTLFVLCLVPDVRVSFCEFAIPHTHTLSCNCCRPL